MFDDRLEKALEAMRNESVTPEEAAAARARVREKLALAAMPTCSEFQPRMTEYLAGRLPEARRVLMADHLARCPECRREMAARRGQPRVAAMPGPRAFAWPQWATYAVAACLMMVVLYGVRHRLDTMLGPSGPRATVAAVSGQLHRVPEGLVYAGTTLAEREIVRTGPGSRAVLQLPDGSAIEVNERTELYLQAAWSGQTIHLQRGDVIVQAAEQRRGQLRVQTRDSVALVRGTVFAVSAGIGGSVVSVLEGAVEVRHPGATRLLAPGEQAVSNAALHTVSMQETVAWSQESEKYLALLADFAALGQQIAAIPAQPLRTEPRLLRFAVPNMMTYGSMPNMTGTVRQAMALAEQQAAGSPAFREWWESEDGRKLRQLAQRIQTVTPALGEEIGFMLAHTTPEGKEQVVVLLAEVQQGRREEVAQALASLSIGENGPLPHYVVEGLAVISDTPGHLQWALAHLGQGAAAPFAVEIARRYQRGAGWLLAVDLAGAAARALGPAVEVTGAAQMQHLFFEQRTVGGAEENEATLSFQRERTGVSSWLAPAGPSGAVEYISSEAVFSVSVATREPRQAFDELTMQIGRFEPNFLEHLREAEAKMGVRLADDIASALGTEFAFAVERPSLPIPAWVAAAVAYQPATLDAAIQRMVEAYNAGLNPDQQERRMAIEQAVAEGRTWNTLRAVSRPFSVTWTYDRGYLVAGADRGVVARAIATRNGGFPLIWSAAFRQQMPGSTGLHASGFLWVNAKGALEELSGFVSQESFKALLAHREPLLVVVNGETEQIRAASRTRISSLLLEFMLAGAAREIRKEQGAPGVLQQTHPRKDVIVAL
jgi:hypothetical protein